MKNTLVPPPNGDPHYGIVEGKEHKWISISEGPVFLREGIEKPRGGRGSFGVEHIWARHSPELILLGYNTINDVARYVAGIILPNTRVFCEPWQMSGPQRLVALRGRSGCAILKETYFEDFEVAYSVITAYPNPQQHGSQVTRIIA